MVKDWGKTMLPYSTGVAVSKTVAEIQAMLVAMGAKGVQFNYNGQGEITTVLFLINSKCGDIGYQLPIDTDRAYEAMKKLIIKRSYKNREQAQRVAWRAVRNWLEAQMALMKINMVEAEQVFLPYMKTTDGGTVYDHYLKGRTVFLALGEGDE